MGTRRSSDIIESNILRSICCRFAGFFQRQDKKWVYTNYDIVLSQILVSSDEERYLIKFFGKDYEQYQKDVNAFIPL